jgi:catechol 2,3-dioxygenase-like lactoylglutathione lyase family enzyme
MFKRIDHVEIVTDQLDRTVQFYTEVLGFTVKGRDRIERSGLGVPIDLVYLDLGGTVVELISYEGGAVDPAPQTEHLGYRMMALEVDDMEKTADYLRTKGVDIVWGPRVRDLLKGGRSATPTAVTSSSGSGPDEPMCSRQAGGSGTVQDDLKRSTYIYKTAAGGFVSFIAEGDGFERSVPGRGERQTVMGDRDCCLENGNGSVGEPKVRTQADKRQRVRRICSSAAPAAVLTDATGSSAVKRSSSRNVVSS